MPKGTPKNGINKGWFKKGLIPWSKGNKKPMPLCSQCQSVLKDRRSKVCRKHHPQTQKGRPAPWAKKNPELFQKGHVPWNKNIKRPEFSGENHPNWISGGISKCDCGNLKYFYAKRCRECFEKDCSGEKSGNFKGGINSVIKRRAQMKNVDGFHTNEQWENLKKKYNYMCLCCKKFEPEIKLTEDHIIPLSLEGSSNDISNIQPLCISCNSIKHTKIINFIETYDRAEL